MLIGAVTIGNFFHVEPTENDDSSGLGGPVPCARYMRLFTAFCCGLGDRDKRTTMVVELLSPTAGRVFSSKTVRMNQGSMPVLRQRVCFRDATVKP